MTSSQVVILCIMIGYLVLNVTIGMIMSKRQERASTMSQEKKYFIGSRGMNGLVLAMTTMATYTSVSSFISGPGAAGMTYGYAQVWVAAVQFGAVFLVMGVLGNRLAIVSRRTGAVTIAGYLKARYKSDGLVIVTSLLMVAFFIAQMISQFTGGATLVESVTGLPYWASLLIFAAVVSIPPSAASAQWSSPILSRASSWCWAPSCSCSSWFAPPAVCLVLTPALLPTCPMFMTT